MNFCPKLWCVVLPYSQHAEKREREGESGERGRESGERERERERESNSKVTVVEIWSLESVHIMTMLD
jgi:hypothetical protein